MLEILRWRGMKYMVSYHSSRLQGILHTAGGTQVRTDIKFALMLMLHCIAWHCNNVKGVASPETELVSSTCKLHALTITLSLVLNILIEHKNLSHILFKNTVRCIGLGFGWLHTGAKITGSQVPFPPTCIALLVLHVSFSPQRDIIQLEIHVPNPLHSRMKPHPSNCNFTIDRLTYKGCYMCRKCFDVVSQ